MKRLRTSLLLLLAISLLMTACASQPASQPNPTPSEPVSLGKGALAMVNGKPVTNQEFIQRAKVYEIYYHDEFFDDEKDKENNRKILNVLLDRYANEVLLLGEAAQRGITVTDQEVAAQVQQFNTLMANAYGAEKLADLKKKKNLVETDIQKAMAATLVIDRLAEQLAGGLKVSEAEIQSYYDKNAATEFTTTQEQIRARHILVAPSDEAKAKEILGRIKSGEDFAKLAMEFSIDTGSGARGGDLGYFGKGAMVKPFEDAAFALKNINDLSEPVKSDFGWHIIQLTGRRAPGTLPLTELRSAIEAQLMAEKTDAEVEKLVTELRSKATVELVDMTQI